MKIGKIQRVEKVMVQLEEDIDFTAKDLEPNALVGGKLLELTKEYRDRIAYEKNFNRATWSGHYDPDTKTVLMEFEKDLYI